MKGTPLAAIIRLVILLVVTLAFRGVAAESLFVNTPQGGSANLRNAQGRVIGTIPDGARIKIDPRGSRKGKWISVIYNGRRGRIYRAFAKSKNTVSNASTSSAPSASRARSQTAERALSQARAERRAPIAQRAAPAPAKKGFWENIFAREEAKPLGNYGGCGEVTVDCGSKRIHFSGATIPDRMAVIDCGRGTTTHNGVGRVGGRVSGNIVKDGVDIRIPGMGTESGGKWFHTPWWKPGQLPTGDDKSKGCPHVSPMVLAKLKTCRNAPLRIINARGAARGGQTSSDRSGVRSTR